MGVRKKAERTWFSFTDGLTITNGLGVSPIFLFPEGGIPSGRQKLQRLIGCVELYGENFAAGSITQFAWHGLVTVEDEDTSTIVIMQRTLNSDDNSIWLWREPIPWFPTPFVPGAGDDIHRSHVFDWQIRGGKGHNLEIGHNTAYVIDFGPAPPFTLLRAGLTCLELYWST